MEGLLARNGLLIKAFGTFVNHGTARIEEHAEAIAAKQHRRSEYLNGHVRKDDYDEALVRDESGLTTTPTRMRRHVFAAVEVRESDVVGAVDQGVPRARWIGAPWSDLTECSLVFRAISIAGSKLGNRSLIRE